MQVRRRLEADHREEEGDPGQQHPRGGYRRAGGGSDQAEPAAEGAGRGKRAVEPGLGTGAAGFGEEHPVRQLADRRGLF